MNINKKIEGEIVSNTLYIAPFNKYYQWTVDHAPGFLSKYMTTIYNYFLYKNEIFRLFESKKFMKICSKTHQIAPFKNIFRGSMSPNPPSKRMTTSRVSILAPPQKIVGPPWQILHTSMNYY